MSNKISVIKPKRSYFNLSHSKTFDCDFGRLIPVMCEEMVPGDKFKISNQVVVRMQPAVAPFLHELKVHVNYFVVPYRILDRKWEVVMTGGDDYTSDGFVDEIIDAVNHEEWKERHNYINKEIFKDDMIGSFWDYLGLPVLDAKEVSPNPISPSQAKNFPSVYPFLAYCMIWDEYYRVENLQEKICNRFPDPTHRYYCNVRMPVDQSVNPDIMSCFLINPKKLNNGINLEFLYSSWKNDYFTSALPFMQRGPAPSIELAAKNLPLNFYNDYTYDNTDLLSFRIGDFSVIKDKLTEYCVIINDTALSMSLASFLTFSVQTSFDWQELTKTVSIPLEANVLTYRDVSVNILSLTFKIERKTPSVMVPGDDYYIYLKDYVVYTASSTFNYPDVNQSVLFTNLTGSVSTQGLGGINISDLRTGFQIQNFLERSARSGTRYIEFLKAHFGTSPRDERLQRPEYIGGTSSPIIISEVLQTSQSTDSSAQGNLAGHGITADANSVRTYTAHEHCFVIGLMTILPDTLYHQGMPRQFTRRSKWDFYFPEFAHLSMQGVTYSEIYWRPLNRDNLDVFGFQGRFDEMRSRQNLVCGNLRPGQNLEYWTLARNFGSSPHLNNKFLSFSSDENIGGPSNRVFAVQDDKDTCPFIVNFANIIHAYRPLPISCEPGYVDHPYY